MTRILRRLGAPVITIALFASSSTAEISQQTRTYIDHVIGHKGNYVSEEGVYKIILPREDASIVQDYQTLSPNLGLNSWVAFVSGVHHEAMLTGQFLLLDDEVNPVLDVVLDAGLEVTGLAASAYSQGPQLHTLDLNGLGSFPTLASAFHKGLETIQLVRRTAAVFSKQSGTPTIPIESAIDAGPLDAVLR